MPAREEYTPEFKDQAVRFVLEEIELDESRKQACERLAPKLSMKAVTLYNWAKQSGPGKARAAAPPGSVEELRALNAALRKENRELARANADLVGRGSFFRCGARPPKEVAVFVAAHRHHGVVPICRTLQVAPSAVRSAMSRPVCARRVTGDAIKVKLLEVFNVNYQVYGRRKMKAALRREHGINLDKDRIARLMRELGIRGATRSKTTVTTRPDRNSPRAPDLVKRQFRAQRPNQLWVSDFTYVANLVGVRLHRVRDRCALPQDRWLAHRFNDDHRVGDGRLEHGRVLTTAATDQRGHRALRCGVAICVRRLHRTPRRDRCPTINRQHRRFL